MRKILVFWALIMLFSSIALADIPPIKPTPKRTEKPKKEATKDAQMFIALSDRVDEPVLVIKKEMFAELRSALDEADDSSAAAATYSNFTRTQTIIGGLFLSLAFVFGGVWLARMKVKIPKTAVGILTLAVIGVATLVSANVPPPRNYGLSSNIFSVEMRRDNAYSQGKIKVIISDDANRGDIQFLIPARRGETEEEE